MHAVRAAFLGVRDTQLFWNFRDPKRPSSNEHGIGKNGAGGLSLCDNSLAA